MTRGEDSQENERRRKNEWKTGRREKRNED